MDVSWKAFREDESAVGVVEIILKGCFAFSIALVIIFRTQLTNVVNNIFSSISSKAGSIYK